MTLALCTRLPLEGLSYITGLGFSAAQTSIERCPATWLWICHSWWGQGNVECLRFNVIMVHTNSHNPNRTLFCLFLKSGLSCWIGEQLLGLQHLALPVVMLAVTVVVAVVTEVISNVATTTLFLPVLASLVSQSGMISLHSCTHNYYIIYAFHSMLSPSGQCRLSPWRRILSPSWFQQLLQLLMPSCCQ